jgi:hypothetical protein
MQRELSLAAGFGLCAVIIAALVVLMILFARISALNGLQRPTTNAVVLTILTNLLPTGFATLLEPFWIILNRIFCVLQPFRDLKYGSGRPEATVRARYTSLPPQLALPRALKAKHYLLAMICFVTMSVNILAVALSTLFTESQVTTTIPQQYLPEYSPAFNGTPNLKNISADNLPVTVLDHFYVVQANLKNKVPLPPWLDNSYYYLPFNIPDLSNQSALTDEVVTTGYSARTRGFGFDIQCHEVLEDDPQDKFRFKVVGDDFLDYSFNHTMENGVETYCGASVLAGGVTKFGGAGLRSNKSLAQEVASSMNAIVLPQSTGNESVQYCSSVFGVSFSRIGPRTNAVVTLNDSSLLLSKFMICEPKFRTAIFDINIDTEGRIISSTQAGPFLEDLTPFGERAIVQPDFANITILADFVGQVNDFITAQALLNGRFRDNSFTTDWFHTMLKLLVGSSDAWDPTKPLPDLDELRPLVEDIYRRLSAAILALNPSIFQTANEGDPLIISSASVTETRIFMDKPMFFLSMILLLIQLVAAIILYWRRPQRFLPRMPLSIASIIAYVAASRATFDSEKDDESTRYAYGRFHGVDGREHVGIEKKAFVIGSETKTSTFPKRRVWGSFNSRDDAEY